MASLPDLLALASFTMFFIAAAQDHPVVYPPSGPLKGTTGQIRSKKIFSFKNIPYAKPPVGHLRFAAPEEVPVWTEVLDAIPGKEPIFCPQIPQYPSTKGKANATGKEDCLFLDIYTTQLPANNSSRGTFLPVLVYFHGGLFEQGSKDQYGPEFLLRENNMVLVIVNYRLGILGFLSTQNKVLPGNLGLLDQRMALKWIQNNIASFGGDAKTVTISGHDAGGASVGLHILSPSSYNYFSAAISGSGTALDPWALTSDARSNALHVAKEIRCPEHPRQNLVNCLRGKSLDQILETQRKLPNLTFRPTIDESAEDPFISDLPSRLYAQNRNHKVPYVAGVTTSEASIEFYSKFYEATKTENLDKIIKFYLGPYLKGTANADSVVKAAKYHYLRGLEFPSYEVIADPVIDMMTDFLYVSGLEQTMKNHSASSPSYMYVFGMDRTTALGDIFGPEERKGAYNGISHMDDVMFLFNTSFADWVKEDEGNALVKNKIEVMNQIWGSFVSKWKPTAGTSTWLPYTPPNSFNYLELSRSIQLKQNYRQYAMDFWKLLVPDLQGVGNNTGVGSSLISGSGFQSATWGVAGLAILLAVLCVALAATVVVTRKRFMKRSSVPISISREKAMHEGRL